MKIFTKVIDDTEWAKIRDDAKKDKPPKEERVQRQVRLIAKDRNGVAVAWGRVAIPDDKENVSIVRVPVASGMVVQEVSKGIEKASKINNSHVIFVACDPALTLDLVVPGDVVEPIDDPSLGIVGKIAKAFGK